MAAAHSHLGTSRVLALAMLLALAHATAYAQAVVYPLSPMPLDEVDDQSPTCALIDSLEDLKGIGPEITNIKLSLNAADTAAALKVLAGRKLDQLCFLKRLELKSVSNLLGELNARIVRINLADGKAEYLAPLLRSSTLVGLHLGGGLSMEADYLSKSAGPALRHLSVDMPLQALTNLPAALESFAYSGSSLNGLERLLERTKELRSLRITLQEEWISTGSDPRDRLLDWPELPPKITSVRVSGAIHLTDRAVRAVLKSPQLRECALVGVIGFSPAALGAMQESTSLAALVLDDCISPSARWLTDEVSTYILKRKALESLVLSGESFSESAMLAMVSQLTNCVHLDTGLRPVSTECARRICELRSLRFLAINIDSVDRSEMASALEKSRIESLEIRSRAWGPIASMLAKAQHLRWLRVLVVSGAGAPYMEVGSLPPSISRISVMCLGAVPLEFAAVVGRSSATTIEFNGAKNTHEVLSSIVPGPKGRTVRLSFCSSWSASSVVAAAKAGVRRWIFVSCHDLPDEAVAALLNSELLEAIRITGSNFQDRELYARLCASLGHNAVFVS